MYWVDFGLHYVGHQPFDTEIQSRWLCYLRSIQKTLRRGERGVRRAPGRKRGWLACARPIALAGLDWHGRTVRAFSLPRFPTGMRTSSLYCSANSGEGWATIQPCAFQRQRYTELLPHDTKDVRNFTTKK
ncbi:jg2263 [Pararge aegeria aegeria]|uniref:Jg2263 protein n=1 Tax=Pararge aegeria aegeria TaxID=348720 RepID=A0A8S4R397_9NEOP|nr:jg2263 [Pararge aegeria aegeria]